MNRLTQKDEQGNWCLKGVKWEQLRVGSVITEDTAERLYSALWNLVEYEDTQELAEEIVDRYTDIFVKSAEERQKRRCREREKRGVSVE